MLIIVLFSFHQILLHRIWKCHKFPFNIRIFILSDTYMKSISLLNSINKYIYNKVLFIGNRSCGINSESAVAILCFSQMVKLDIKIGHCKSLKELTRQSFSQSFRLMACPFRFFFCLWIAFTFTKFEMWHMFTNIKTNKIFDVFFVIC